jgi:hypothetical protein
MKKLEDTKGVVKKAVNRRTDNTMLKRKRIKGQTTIYKTQDRSLKIEQHYPTKKTRDEFRCSTSSRNNSGVLRAPERIQVFYKLQKEFRCSTSSRKYSGVLRAPERIQVFYELQKECRCSTSSRKKSDVL